MKEIAVREVANKLEEGTSSPKVFISYSHDSELHRDRVLQLSERLREDGVDAIIDQYVKGVPEQGWPRWMLDQLDAADYVLIVCTETYYRRFRGHEEPGKGKGVDWEGALITLEIYKARSRTVKFVPVFLSDFNEAWIPDPLRAWNYYALNSEDEYKRLYDFLLDQAGVEPREMGPPKKKPRRKGEVMIFPGSENIKWLAHSFTPTRLAAAVLLIAALVFLAFFMLRAPALTVLPGPYETLVPSRQEQIDDVTKQWSLELQVTGSKPQIVKPYWGQPFQFGKKGLLAIATGDEVRIRLRSSINECVEWSCKIEKSEGWTKTQEFTLDEKPFTPCQ